MHAADCGQKGVGFPGPSRALDKEYAECRIWILPECLRGDCVQRRIRLRLDPGHIEALLVGRTRKRRDRAKDSIEFRAFEGLEP